MTTERIDVLAVLDFHLSTRDGGLPGSMYANEHARLSEARAAVAELIDRADTVANYSRIAAPDDEYVEIPRATIDGLIAAIARVGGAS